MPVTTIAVTMVLPIYLAIVPLYSGLQRRYASRVGRRPAPRPERFRPDVDVIVPCYNEEPALLAACLWSLRLQDYKGEMRVWVSRSCCWTATAASGRRRPPRCASAAARWW
jgi:N-acetylglucosaminyltransferase